MALWDAFAYAQANAVALRDQLKANAIATRQLFSGGAIELSSSDGHVTRFAKGEANSLTPAQIAEVWVYLVEEFDRALAELGGTPTDSQVEALMETNLRPSLGYVDNWQFLSK